MSIYGHIDGRLTRDSELKSVGENQVLKFAVATDRYEKKQKIVQFINCDFWGSRAASIAQYMLKGQLVSIRGDIFNREYQAKDGTTKVSMECRVDDVKLMGGKNDKSEDSGSYKKDAPASGGESFNDDVPF